MAGRQATSEVGGLVVAAVDAAVDALRGYVDRDWRDVRARDLDWSVWDTLVHVNDDLYFYAAQALLADADDYICCELRPDAHATPARLLAALAVNGRLLAAAVGAADPRSTSHHVFGASDPAGFAAMGVVETLVHTWDAAHGLDETSTWRPPDDLAGPVLRRLFRAAPADGLGTPGEHLLHRCGRIALGDRPRPTDWRWDGTPRLIPSPPMRSGVGRRLIRMDLDHAFTAPVEKDGAYPTFVTVPDSVAVLGTGRPVKVSGTLAGVAFDATLMPSGAGAHWLPLRAALRDAIGDPAAGTVVAVHLTGRR